VITIDGWRQGTHQLLVQRLPKVPSLPELSESISLNSRGKETSETSELRNASLMQSASCGKRHHRPCSMFHFVIVARTF